MIRSHYCSRFLSLCRCPSSGVGCRRHRYGRIYGSVSLDWVLSAASMQWHSLCRRRKGWGWTVQCDALALAATGMNRIQTGGLNIIITTRCCFGSTCGRTGPSWLISSGQTLERTEWLACESQKNADAFKTLSELRHTQWPRLTWSNCILLSFEFAHRMFQVQVWCGCGLVVTVPLCEFAAKLRLYNWMLGSTSEHKRTHCIPKFREVPCFNAPLAG